MSKPANKTLIGAFVLGALVLMIVGVLLFGSGRLFSERQIFVLYFEGSVKGLTVGSPVNFRGVKIGTVKEIKVSFDPKEHSLRIPVLIEIDASRILPMDKKGPLNKVHLTLEKENLIKEMVNRGLRAQLQLENLITGQLGVELDFYPGTPAKLTKIASRYPEIPTIPSNMEELQKTLDKAFNTLEKLPFDILIANLVETTKGINQLINSPQLDKNLRSLDQTLNELQALIKNINNQIGPLTSGVDENFKALRVTLEQTQKTLSTFEKIAREDSSLRFQLSETIEQVSDAARSLRTLADYLEQHPEAILRGKSK